MTQAPSGSRYALTKPIPRLLVPIAIALAVYFLAPIHWWEIRVLLAFDVGLLLHLGILGIYLWQATPEETARRAHRKEASNVALLTVVVLFSLFSLLGVTFMLDNSQKWPPLLTNIHMGLSLLAIFQSWMLVHIYYAIHYARLYYADNPAIAQSGSAEPFARGLAFPHEGLVSYRDFLYYSLTIAMCYQTSDVSILSSEMRSISLVQSVLSFIFVAVIFGLVVNVVSNVV
jgi:uncharacterized membrane protein